MKITISIIPTLFFGLFAGCATSPEGSPELLKSLEADRKNQSSKTASISEGRPLFIKVQSYPQLLNSGDIWLGGNMLIYIGNEKLNYLDLVTSHQNKPSGIPITPNRTVAK